ncbi:ATP-binding protein [Actinacidiphila acididurans]|uniref:ATP-binding protein n=1 Tax=Actinacidiphila acididurans TaxID=2784346 RepID=A0ABS2TXW8_9ACTN|nr:ATP-binding protein [Actinacidiphila acididurans]MBM9507927.1 ATP-binding protein [Actinacidiphila acididurans]
MLPVPKAPTGPHIVARRWTQHPDNVRRARDELRLHLLKWRVPVDVSDSAVLVLSELLTNSLRHAVDPEGHHIETRFERRRNGVRIEVHDASEGNPQLREASPEEDSGRGLTLVHVLTGGQWGVSSREGIGKLVWAECLPENDERAPR